MYKLNQAVITPKGPATFIGYFGDGTRVQVSRRATFTELTREEIETYKPAVKEWDRETYAAWLKRATFIRNEIYPLDEIKAA